MVSIQSDVLCEIFSKLSMKDVRGLRVLSRSVKELVESNRFLFVYEKNNKVECRKFKFMLYAIRNMYTMMRMDKFVNLKMTPELLSILECRINECNYSSKVINNCAANESIPFEFYEKYSNIFNILNLLERRNDLNVIYYEKHIDCINIRNWYFICGKKLPEWFFEKHIEKWQAENNWCVIIKNKHISTQFIEKNLRIDSSLSPHIWICLCDKNFPASFYEKHISCVNFNTLAYRTDLPLDFYEKYIDKFIPNIYILIHNPSIPFEFLIPYINNKHHYNIIDYLK